MAIFHFTRSAARGVMLVSASSLALALAPPAMAGANDVAAAPDPGPTAERAVPGAEPDDGNVIVVSASRLAGQLDTSVTPELVLDETAIASYGASSVAELVAALSPQTQSGRGRGGGGQPVVLVNGRRVSGFQELRSLSPDAIAKVEVFPEEVALQYGFSSEQRVINFVLKPDYRQIAVEVDTLAATQGRFFGQAYDANLVRISPNSRVNLTANYNWQGLLTEDERGLIPASGVAADASARSIVPSGDEYFVDASFQRGLDKVTDVTLAARLSETNRLSLIGPSLAGATDPLERTARTRSLTGGTSVNGMVGRWRWSASANYSDVDQLTFTDRLAGTADRFASSQQRFGGNATASGPLAEGWAGPVRMTLASDYDGLRFASQSVRGATVAATALTRDVVGGSGTISVPILDPEYGAGTIGRVTLNGNIGVRDVSDFSALLSWGGGVNWALTRQLSLNASYASDEAAPGIQQLGDAPLITPQTPVFDFARGETVFIETLSGGNPLLRAEQRRDFKLGLNWTVVRDVNLTANWNRNRSDDTSNSFPLLTPEIEAAFADRVTRDASGRLTRLDIRPVNFDENISSQIRWGINTSGAVGKPPPAGRGGPGARGGGPGARGGGSGARGGGPGRMVGMMGGGGQGRWSASVYHSVLLANRITIRPGVPVLDLLNGSAIGGNGGANRHSIEADGGLFHNGMGFRASGRFDSGSRVSGGASGNDLNFGALATFNLRGFVNFDSKPATLKKMPWLTGIRLRVSVDNLFDAQRRVTDANGLVPLRYQPGYTDPRGRVVEFDIRKRF